MIDLLLSSCENGDSSYGIAVAFCPGQQTRSGHEKDSTETSGGNLMKSPNCVAIMGILAEMARRLNENISKVELKPLQALGMRGMESTKAMGEVAQA
jgi:hypothetical protein